LFLAYRVACKVSYDGTNYHGWQRQDNAIGVQEVIEDSIQKLHNGTRVDIHGASRTDQGVHALGQVFHFDTSLDIPMERMALAINTYLPKDIFIQSAWRVDDTFHARKSATQKTYVYKCMVDTYWPHLRNGMGFVKGPLDIKRMQQELSSVIGTHHFQALTQNASYDSYERTVFSASLKTTMYGLELTITGSGFLRHMVRILMGTLILLGQGHPSTMSEILASKDRLNAGLNVAPEGLYLCQVDYE
jgi:tRNA pseudouridine38-40 synthase